MADAAAAYAWTGWPTRRPKLHVHQGITVEIRPGRPEIAIYQDGKLCPDHRTVAGRVVSCGGSLRARASVAVFLDCSPADHHLIAAAVRRADHLGADRPGGVPADAQLIDLPFSEVCMHMRVAGRLRWVAPLEQDMAQLYDVHGRPFSAPILRCEAGLRAVSGCT